MERDRCDSCQEEAPVLFVVEQDQGERELRCLADLPERDYDPRHR